MRREDGMVAGRANAAIPDKQAQHRLTKREIDRQMTAIGAQLARAFEDRERERIEYLGEELFPMPMSTKQLVRIMSRYLVFN